MRNLQRSCHLNRILFNSEGNVNGLRIHSARNCQGRIGLSWQNIYLRPVGICAIYYTTYRT